MLKYILITFCHFTLLLSSKSQDTTIKSTNSKAGIYATWKEFNLGQPSITSQFKMLQHNFIDEDFLDSFKYNYYCKFNDSGIKLNSAFAVFDGESLYIFMRELNDTLLFCRAKYAGKFPYFVFKYKEGIAGGNLLTLATTAVNAATAKPKRGISYINAKGKVVLANPQSVGFLIRKESDLSEEFTDEKSLNSEVLEKYILKMNLRYPL